MLVGLALAVRPGRHWIRLTYTAGFVVGLLVELVTGACLNFLVMIVFSTIRPATLVDLFGGFQLAQGFRPEMMMINGAQFARLYQMTALACCSHRAATSSSSAGSRAASTLFRGPAGSISPPPSMPFRSRRRADAAVSRADRRTS
jgi:hypothetical protein